MEPLVNAPETKELTAEAQQRWEAISDQVEKIWAEIFGTANKILQVHVKFGFSEFAAKIDPSVDDILLSLKVVESLLDTLYTSGTLEYSESRMVHNAKQQIWLVQCIAEALKNGNEEDYTAAIKKLGDQAQI
jgi:hypothetical protein